jgi:hypothetical protein
MRTLRTETANWFARAGGEQIVPSNVLGPRLCGRPHHCRATENRDEIAPPYQLLIRTQWRRFDRCSMASPISEIPYVALTKLASIRI